MRVPRPKAIGARLDISVKTVETHKARLKVKLDVRARADIVRYALSQGWLQDDTPVGNSPTEGGRPRFNPHGLRHTYAALHLQAGTDVYYVSRMLGHADIGLTVGTYGAWLQPDRQAAVDVLDRTPTEGGEEARA